MPSEQRQRLVQCRPLLEHLHLPAQLPFTHEQARLAGFTGPHKWGGMRNTPTMPAEACTPIVSGLAQQSGCLIERTIPSADSRPPLLKKRPMSPLSTFEIFLDCMVHVFAGSAQAGGCIHRRFSSRWGTAEQVKQGGEGVREGTEGRDGVGQDREGWDGAGREGRVAEGPGNGREGARETARKGRAGQGR